MPDSNTVNLAKPLSQSGPAEPRDANTIGGGRRRVVTGQGTAHHDATVGKPQHTLCHLPPSIGPLKLVHWRTLVQVVPLLAHLVLHPQSGSPLGLTALSHSGKLSITSGDLPRFGFRPRCRVIWLLGVESRADRALCCASFVTMHPSTGFERRTFAAGPAQIPAPRHRDGGFRTVPDSPVTCRLNYLLGCLANPLFSAVGRC